MAVRDESPQGEVPRPRRDDDLPPQEVWGDEPRWVTCPRCALKVEPGLLRCPRCNALVVMGCTGVCGSCPTRTCARTRRLPS